MSVMKQNFVNGLMIHVKNLIVQMQLIKIGAIEYYQTHINAHGIRVNVIHLQLVLII